MKQLEKMMMLACIFMIANIVVQLGWNALSNAMEGSTDVSPKMFYHIKALSSGILKLLVPLVISVWLYREAKRDGSTPWIWVLLALVYQFLAPILYYAMKIHRAMIAEQSGGNSAS
jgi:cellobiose-specific phosphotransferase system component IIC